MDEGLLGGVADESSGMQLNRDNWNLVLGHNWVAGDNKVNEARFQFGQKYFEEPANSNLVSEYYSLGNTLITGANIVGDQDMTGDYLSLSDTFSLFLGSGKSTHNLKFGGSISVECPPEGGTTVTVSLPAERYGSQPETVAS